MPRWTPCGTCSLCRRTLETPDGRADPERARPVGRHRRAHGHKAPWTIHPLEGHP